MDSARDTTPRRDLVGLWDTEDRRLVRRGVELRRDGDTWTLRLPRPRALGPGESPVGPDEGGRPPLEFVEVLWPFTGGRELLLRSPEPLPPEAAAGGHLKRTLTESTGAVTRAIPWLRVGEAEPTHVRVARTAVRRLRTHHRGARVVSEEPLPGWDGLAMLNDHLRAVRDLDIVARTLPLLHRGVGASRRGESDRLLELIDAVRGERRRARNELWAELVHPRTADLLDVLDAAPLVLAPDHRTASDRDLAMHILRSQVDAARNRARAADDDDPQALMAFRTALRRVRVVAISSSDVLGEDARRLARRAAEVQDALGPLADLRKTTAWLDRIDEARGAMATLIEELGLVAVQESQDHVDAWRGPWERFTRRRVLRWL